MPKIQIFPRMALFDVSFAVEHGLTTAVVDQELYQAAMSVCERMTTEGITWFRFDPQLLEDRFPYFPLKKILSELVKLEKMERIMIWRSINTDFIWISWRGA